MAINTIKATIQMRKGLEQDFDADRMTAGEWAVSTDTKYVRMCFSPGVVFRMATYEAFEEDMLEIQRILATCQDIQVAVDAMADLANQHKEDAANYALLSESWAHGDTGSRLGENTDNSEYYSNLAKSEADRAKEEADKAASIAGFSVDQELSTTSTNPVANRVITEKLNEKLGKSDVHEWAKAENKPSYTKSEVGLGNVDNTADATKNVATAEQVNGKYTWSDGGKQPPSYVTSGKTRFNMMNAFKGITNPSGSYMDTILMDNYTGSNVPYVTGIGVTKNNGNPRMFIANGAKGNTENWAHQVEVVTTGNLSSQTAITELNSSLSATQIIKTGSKSISLSATETWYRLGYLENGNKIFGEFLVCSSWDYNIPDICKFTVGGANNGTVSYDIVKQFYSHRGVGLTGSSIIKRIKKIRVCYYPNGVERNIYIDVCLKAGASTNPDAWSYELSMYRDGVAGNPGRWVNSNFEANPAIPSGYAVKELDLADINVSDFILYRTFTKDNFDVGANTYIIASISYTVPSGYKMLCVVDVNIDNATSSGINKSSCNTYDTDWNNGTITVGIRNRGTNAAKLKLEARVLFILDRNI